MGRHIATAANAFFSAGEHSVSFERGDLANGNYLIVLRAGTETQTSWMMVAK
jgi:hypothetical protein